MRKFLILVFIVGFAASVSAQKKPHCASTTKKVVVFFEKKKYVEINKLFSESLKKSVSAEQLGQIWESVCKKGGGFVAFGQLTESVYNKRPVNTVVCELKKEKQLMTINYTSDGEICGLFFQAATAK